MAENSKIEWTHHTFNPWRGCTKVAPECANCYADTLSKRNPSTLGVWGPNGTRVVAAESYWKQPLKWNREAAAAGERRRVFCASMADVFEDWAEELRNTKGEILHRCRAGHVHGLDAVYVHGAECQRGCNRAAMPMDMDDVRRRLFALIDATPWLDWLLLTKRPENIRRMWPQPINGHDYGSEEQIARNRGLRRTYGVSSVRHLDKAGARPNVWLGTSAGTQETADKAIPELLKCRDLAPVLFLSCEPLLGPVNFRWTPYHHQATGETGRQYLERVGSEGEYESLTQLDWVICGGESGHGARPMNQDWARFLRDQCKGAGVPFFFKQWGESVPVGQLADLPENKFECDDDCVVKIGKHRTGRLLDGVEHNEFPETQPCHT